MTAFDYPACAPGATGFGVRLIETARGFARACKNRRQVKYLMHLSDHELADIGLMRTDLEVVMHMPLSVDPTTRLRRFAYERGLAACRAHSFR